MGSSRGRPFLNGPAAALPRTVNHVHRRVEASPQPAQPAGARGFSILEMLIVISLLAIFMGTIYEAVIVGLRATHAADEREAVRQQLAGAIDRLTREAGLTSNVDVAQDQQLQFDADLDGNGTTESDIVYQLQSGVLQRTYGGATVTLARGITSLDFDYLDLNGSSLAAPLSGCNLDTVRVLQVTVTGTNDTETLSMTTAAFLRNNR